MKSIVFYGSIVLSLLNAENSLAQIFSWAQGFPVVGSQATRILSTTFDSSNNVYSLGWFSGTIDVDRSTNVYNLTSVGNYNMFLLKQDSAGGFLWAKHFHCKSPINLGFGISPSDVSLDENGNIYIAGTFSDTIDFDPGLGTHYIGPPMGVAINFNGFILKLDATGNFIWVKQIGGAAGAGIAIDDMKMNRAGEIFLCGGFNGTIDADPGTGVSQFTPINANWAMLIEKLDSAGNFLWAKQINGLGWFVLDTASNLYFAGGFQDTVDFDPGPGVANLFSGSSVGSAIFIAKFDSAGNYLWVKQVGIAANDAKAQGVSIDSFGNLAVVGYYNGLMDFDPGPGIHNITGTSRDMFVLRLRNNGDFSWVKSVHPGGNDDARAVTTDAQGNVYTTGEFFSPADFDPGPGVHMLNGGVYVQKLDSAGNFVWAVDWQADLPHWIGLDYSNSVYSTGHFSGANRDFDPGTGTFLLSGSNNGSGYIHKLTQSVIDNVQNVTNDSEQITVYPNPSSGVVRFSSSSKMEKIAIADMTGKTVLTAHPQQTHIDINMAGRSAGVYFYTVETNGHQQRGKLVVR